MIVTICKATGQNFIRHYLPYFPPGSRLVANTHDALQAIPCASVVLFEWANDLTAQIINSAAFAELQRRHNFTTVVRIHDHEVTKVVQGRRRIDAINWSRVDTAWFINPLIRQQFHELGHHTRSFFLPNAVDPTLFPENVAEGRKIGLVSIYYRRRKRIDRVVALARALPDYSFHIRAEIPYRMGGHEYQQVYNEIRSQAAGLTNIHFENRLAVPMIRAGYDVSDLVKWYQDKSIILSTSDHEGFHYAIAEGALSGCMPVVWRWPGAEHFWKPYLVQDVQQAIERIQAYQPSGVHRLYVEQHYHPAGLTRRLLAHIHTKTTAQ